MSDEKQAKQQRNWGFAWLSFAFAGALSISWWSVQAVSPKRAQVAAPPTTAGLDGFPTSVNPHRLLARVRSMTQRQELRGWMATGVRPNGTVDLTQRSSAARYRFDSLPGAGRQPEAGARPGAEFCGRQTLHLTGKGLFAGPDLSRGGCRANAGPGLPSSKCSLEGLWKLAIAQGATASERAVVEYYWTTEGPAWKFTIPGTAVRFVVAGDCHTKLTGQDSLKR